MYEDSSALTLLLAELLAEQREKLLVEKVVSDEAEAEESSQAWQA